MKKIRLKRKLKFKEVVAVVTSTERYNFEKTKKEHGFKNPVFCDHITGEQFIIYMKEIKDFSDLFNILLLREFEYGRRKNSIETRKAMRIFWADRLPTPLSD